MNTRISTKSSVLYKALEEVFDKKINKARIKLISLFIIALCQVRTVNFESLAIAFDHNAKKGSSLRRILRFMANFDLNFDLIAKIIFTLLPKEPPYSLSIDRTNWKFGSKHINILVLAVTYKGLAFPLLFKVKPKAGNSSTQQRIDFINEYIDLFSL